MCHHDLPRPGEHWGASGMLGRSSNSRIAELMQLRRADARHPQGGLCHMDLGWDGVGSNAAPHFGTGDMLSTRARRCSSLHSMRWPELITWAMFCSSWLPVASCESAAGGAAGVPLHRTWPSAWDAETDQNILNRQLQVGCRGCCWAPPAQP